MYKNLTKQGLKTLKKIGGDVDEWIKSDTIVKKLNVYKCLQKSSLDNEEDLLKIIEEIRSLEFNSLIINFESIAYISDEFLTKMMTEILKKIKKGVIFNNATEQINCSIERYKSIYYI